MGAKICNPSSEKLQNQHNMRNLEPLDHEQSVIIPINNSDALVPPDDPYDDDQFEIDEDSIGQIDLDLPYYDKELIFQRLPFFLNEEDFDYQKVLHKYLVRVVGWESSSTNKIATMMDTKRVLSQIKVLEKTLPCQSTNSIFVAINENDMTQMQAVIFGSEGTPYQHGAFLYTINLSDTYPGEPPKVNLETTGNMKIRFNPNLYESGYVCLSLLGTWRGEPKENWQPNHSNISQTIVMNEDVYYNEPSYQDFDRIAGKDFNTGYQNIVRFGNLAYAMNQMLKHPPEQFKRIIKTHFYLKRNKILQTVYRWIQDEAVADYGDLVQDHNYYFCSRYAKPWVYKNDLITEFQKLYVNLVQIKLADTYLVELPRDAPTAQSGKLQEDK